MVGVSVDEMKVNPYMFVSCEAVSFVCVVFVPSFLGDVHFGTGDPRYALFVIYVSYLKSSVY